MWDTSPWTVGLEGPRDPSKYISIDLACPPEPNDKTQLVNTSQIFMTRKNQIVTTSYLS